MQTVHLTSFRSQFGTRGGDTRLPKSTPGRAQKMGGVSSILMAVLALWTLIPTSAAARGRGRGGLLGLRTAPLGMFMGSPRARFRGHSRRPRRAAVRTRYYGRPPAAAIA